MSDYFQDPAAEITVLSGVMRYGYDAYLDASDLIEASEFRSDHRNGVIWSCMKDFYEIDTNRKLDIPSLLSTARKLGYEGMLESSDNKKFLGSLLRYPVELSTVQAEAGKLFKLSVLYDLDERASLIRKKLSKFSGDERLDEIVNAVEGPILEYTDSLNTLNEGTKQIATGIDTWLEGICEEERETIGIPSPFPIYNACIGGGFRRKSIAVIGGRMKSFKTFFLNQVALHTAGTLDIPVINVDTEMSDEEHWVRTLSQLTGIPSDRIELGKLSYKEKERLKEKADWLKTIPYYYRSIVGESFEEQIAIMRRWVLKSVGVDEYGVRKPCLVIYDYIQADDAENIKSGKVKEWQALGFYMMSLLKFVKRHDVSNLSGVQLNREAANKNVGKDNGDKPKAPRTISTATVAGSDYIGRKCGNLSVLIRKTREEMQEDGDHNGGLMLIPLVARHGPGMDDGDYIHVKFSKETCELQEMGTKFGGIRGTKAPNTEQKFKVVDDKGDISDDSNDESAPF